MNEASGQTSHRSTQRVLAIFDALAAHANGLTMAELCRQLDAPKSSLFPILHTMADSDYLAYDRLSTRYSIGIKAYLLSKSFERENSVLPLVRTQMQQVVNSCGETSQLGILERGRVLYIDKVDSSQLVQLKSDIGKTLPFFTTAIGKALASELPEGEVRDMLAAEQADASLGEKLLRELEDVRKTGFAYDWGETTPDIRCIAVPLRHNGSISYGLSVSTPTYRLTQEKESQIKAALDTARTMLDRALA